MITPGIFSSETHKAVIFFQPDTGAIADERVQHAGPAHCHVSSSVDLSAAALQPPQVRSNRVAKAARIAS